ncbi:MAG: type II secretion system protein [Candidatus Gracilibacteria bacterium]|nr:type II secretion system protein [Candidatus Gracilibacteria bacterium]
MKSYKNKGFTLVELLVVITIIGLLSTLGIQQFTGAQQKARDTTRISHIKDMEGGIKQYYNDKSEYPPAGTFSGEVRPYLPVLPNDPKTGKNTCAASGGVNTICDYVYAVGKDENSMQQSAFELSSGFESKQNLDGKAKVDNGDCNDRMEIGDKFSKATRGIETTSLELDTSCTGSDANLITWRAGPHGTATDQQQGFYIFTK